jgi:hypothetical protein
MHRCLLRRGCTKCFHKIVDAEKAVQLLRRCWCFRQVALEKSHFDTNNFKRRLLVSKYDAS